MKGFEPKNMEIRKEVIPYLLINAENTEYLTDDLAII